MKSNAGVEDLTTSELMKCLKAFDGRLSRNISLVVDLPMELITAQP
jgi:hypothetical protein